MRKKACVGLNCFQPILYESVIFSFEFIKVCLAVSAWNNQIPHPLWVVIKCPAPGQTKFIKFLPPGQEKASNAGGMGGGGDVKASISLVH